MRARKRRSLGCITVLVVVLIAIPLASGWWLPLLGTSLQNAGPPVKADIAVVLGGDFFGNRILKAAQLARDGYVPKVFISGPSGEYGLHECDLAIPFAVRHGYPESMFVCGRNDARSTRDEAQIIVPELRRLGVHSYLLVTSDFHTGRAGRLFRKAGPDLEMHAVAAPDEEFRLDRWWDNRQGKKEVVMEWSKTFANWLGL